MRRFLHWLRRVLRAFWLVPILCVVVAIVAAELLVALDRTVNYEDLPFWSTPVFQLGIDGSRGLLAMIGGSTFAAAATAFSITISVIVTASTTYGPRLVGNFMADRRNQLTLGALVSTFVYTTLVIRTIRSATDDGSAFVPHFAVNAAILAAVADVFLLISFIHHIARTTQVDSLTSSVAASFNRAIEDVQRRTRLTSVDAEAPVGGVVVRSGRTGCVIQLDEQGLLEAAAADGGQIVLEVGIGDRVVEGTPIARLIVGTDAEALERAVYDSIDLDEHHNPETDIRFAQHQVLELAVRALSPGTNDPYTAIAVIEDLVPQMAAIVRSPKPVEVLGDENAIPRVFLRPVKLEELIDVPFDHVLPFVGPQPAVYLALVDLAGHIEQQIAHDDLQGYAFRHVERMRAIVAKSDDLSLGRFEERVAHNERLIDLARRPPHPASVD